MVEISSEHSAQPKAQKPNPMVLKAINYLDSILKRKNKLRVADQGCGALRHLDLLLNTSNYLCLVDTAEQFKIVRTLDGTKTTVPDFIGSLYFPNTQLITMTAKEFAASSIGLDVIFNICTLNVVLPDVREKMIASAQRNLNPGGYLVLIVPRNDISIISRCCEQNRYSDGHYFQRNSIYTFFTNFRNYDRILSVTSQSGFVLGKDFSTCKQICLILRLNQSRIVKN